MCTYMCKWKSCIHVHNVYIHIYMSTHTYALEIQHFHLHNVIESRLSDTVTILLNTTSVESAKKDALVLLLHIVEGSALKATLASSLALVAHTSWRRGDLTWRHSTFHAAPSLLLLYAILVHLIRKNNKQGWGSSSAMGYLPSTCSAQDRLPTKEREGEKKIQHESSSPPPQSIRYNQSTQHRRSLLQLTRVVYNTERLTMTSVHPHSLHEEQHRGNHLLSSFSSMKHRMLLPTKVKTDSLEAICPAYCCCAGPCDSGNIVKI